MTRKPKSTVGLSADPNDPDDFDVSEAAIDQALAERRARRGGRPRGSNKEQVAIRLDKDVLEKFRATGPGWQTRINDALRAAVTK
ncbi:BrnA antitoxin family protein [Sphingomonas sp. LaA6.9]|uniref:BrnA antitoxin family protein n=1 Tax=Sphingomonas sp. LaA6.9 TaxID=2919914 RepID=UPI001F4FE396|nr:BrnA antitoxin family protein [Sphingomonas sp. LaA6.9]MCJ8158354.1 BrnA antitoxin family protein [Sphingomonas sp. LaA6.9]